MTFSTTQHAATIRNLLDRDADCRCGGVQITDEERASLEHAAKILGLTERPAPKTEAKNGD